MNAKQIKAVFEAIATRSTNNEVGELITQLGDLLFEQFTIIRQNQETFIEDVKTLRIEFQELSTLVMARLQNNETYYSEKVERFIERAHNLSSRFMVVEDKVDELAEYITVSSDELRDLLQQLVNRDDTKANDT